MGSSLDEYNVRLVNRSFTWWVVSIGEWGIHLSLVWLGSEWGSSLVVSKKLFIYLLSFNYAFQSIYYIHQVNFPFTLRLIL